MSLWMWLDALQVVSCFVGVWVSLVAAKLYIAWCAKLGSGDRRRGWRIRSLMLVGGIVGLFARGGGHAMRLISEVGDVVLANGMAYQIMAWRVGGALLELTFIAYAIWTLKETPRART